MMSVYALDYRATTVQLKHFIQDPSRVARNAALALAHKLIRITLEQKNSLFP
jgi:hypothetical protein